MQTGSVIIRRKLLMYNWDHVYLLSFRRTASSLLKQQPPCPFKILGVTRETPYAAIKKSFLKIAMQNHPDVVNQHLTTLQLNDVEREKRRKQCIQLFVNARQAFESIVPIDDDGGCALRTEVEQEASKTSMNKEEFDAWFLNETGRNNPYQFDLDPATIREVADMTEKLGGDFGGGERDGGMWSLARMISQTVKSGKDAASVLRLEAGEIKDNNNTADSGDGRIRRRRQSRFEY